MDLPKLNMHHVRTLRMEMWAVTHEHLPDLHALHSDPAIWHRNPTGRHTSLEQTEEWITDAVRDWGEYGLGYWYTKMADDVEEDTPLRGQFIGVGGVTLKYGSVWSLYYCFIPQAWGNGFGSEIARLGRAACGQIRIDLPVTARVLESDVPARKAAESAELTIVRRVPDPGNPDPTAVRLVMTDRKISPAMIDLLAEKP